MGNKLLKLSNSFDEYHNIMATSLKKTLQEIGLSHNEAKVYIALTQLGEAPASEIAKRAGVPRTTAISLLEKLEKENYISIQIYRGKHQYWIESPHMIKEALLARVGLAEELNELLTDLYRSEADFPYAKIYDSKPSIKKFIEKIILGMEKNSEILTIDNVRAGNYERILSEDFFYQMLEFKRQRGVMTRTLVPHGTVGEVNPQKVKSQSIQLRELPPGVDFKASLWIMKDTLVLFSGKYPFIVAVKHKIITESLKSIFTFLWSLPKISQN